MLNELKKQINNIYTTLTYSSDDPILKSTNQEVENPYYQMSYLEKKDTIVFSKKDSDYIYLAMEMQNGLIIYKGTLNKDEIIIEYAPRSKFEREEYLAFDLINKRSLNAKELYYYNNFYNILKQTKELRLKLLLEKSV